jgi:hypothetical protein
MAMTPEQRVMRARIAALARWAKYKPDDQMEAAREKFRSSFEKKVDPEGVLPEAERLRRAEAARRAHYQQLALASSRARAARKAQRPGS